MANDDDGGDDGFEIKRSKIDQGQQPRKVQAHNAL